MEIEIPPLNTPASPVDPDIPRRERLLSQALSVVRLYEGIRDEFLDPWLDAAIRDLRHTLSEDYGLNVTNPF